MRLCFAAVMAALAVMSMGATAYGEATDFDDLALGAESYWNGSDYSGGFSSGFASFNNTFTDWGWGYTSWEGFAYSNLSQQEPPLDGTAGQYTAVPGIAHSGANYGLGFVGWAGLPAMMTLAKVAVVQEAYFTNNNYAYYSMLNSDWVAKKFGGATGDDEDWFLLTIEGWTTSWESTGTVEFYLADYRFADNGQDYIVDEWTGVDLSSLGAVRRLTFSLTSSDNDPLYGMNTPGYFAVDSFVITPEPTCLAVLALAGFVLICKRS